MKLDLIGMVVADIPASVAFYRKLGLNVPDFGPDEDHVETTTSHGIRIAWDTETLIASIDPEWVKPVGQRQGMAFLCDSVEEVDQTYASLVADGYKSHKAPWDAFWGQRYAQIVDPDGAVVDLFAPLPG